MKNSVAFNVRQDNGEIKLAATDERNVRYGFGGVDSLSYVAVGYGVFFENYYY
jgi:hypothetical protein